MTTKEFIELLKELDPEERKTVRLEYEVGPPYPVTRKEIRVEDEDIVISIC